MTAPARFTSRRVQAMPGSVFAAMDAAKSDARRSGLDVIDLSIGASDLQPPAVALDTLRAAVHDPATHAYCLHSGTAPLREAVADWFERRFALRVDPETQVLPLIGAQEGFAHLLLACADPGDAVLLPDPAYPSYFGAVAAAGLDTVSLPLRAERGFLPDLGLVDAADAARARALVLSYPNNPTAGVATPEFFDEALRFAERHDLLLIHDFPYVDLVDDVADAPSVLTRPGALDRAVEIYSASKSFHMGGFRLGWAIGQADALAALARLKGAVDFNQYLGIQRAVAAALREPDEARRADAATFTERREVLVESMAAISWHAPMPRASMYVWAALPAGRRDSVAFAEGLARTTGVALAPGVAFGPSGEGYVRFALVRGPEALRQAVARIRAYLD